MHLHLAIFAFCAKIRRTRGDKIVPERNLKRMNATLHGHAAAISACLSSCWQHALIGTLTFSFARITAALKMKVEDLRPRGPGWTVRLHEKGGKEHVMPCHHALSCMPISPPPASPRTARGWLFRSAPRQNADALTTRPIDQYADQTLRPTRERLTQDEVERIRLWSACQTRQQSPNWRRARPRSRPS